MNTGIQEYRELLPIVRKLVRVKWRLRVTISCGENTQTHAHCVKSDAQFKRICINKPDMNLSREGKAATLVHECLHFKGFLSHTKKFWKAQGEFIRYDYWLEIAYPKKRISLNLGRVFQGLRKLV